MNHYNRPKLKWTPYVWFIHELPWENDLEKFSEGWWPQDTRKWEPLPSSGPSSNMEEEASQSTVSEPMASYLINVRNQTKKRSIWIQTPALPLTKVTWDSSLTFCWFSLLVYKMRIKVALTWWSCYRVQWVPMAIPGANSFSQETQSTLGLWIQRNLMQEAGESRDDRD